MSDLCVLAQIRGQVQGVGFRYYTQIQARALGIRGWVRNEADGSVEACICGTRQQVEDMQAWLKQGPTHARVDHISFSPAADLPDSWQDFTVRY